MGSQDRVSAATVAGYRDRLDRVAAHIHDHLDEDIDLERLAGIACLSPWHWHRVYAAMQGETIAQTVRRLRLQRAAHQLANTDLPVEAVAGKAGYGSASAFGRAFRDAYGMPPARYREQGSHAGFKAAEQAEDAGGFPVEIIRVPALRCARVRHVGSYMEIDRAFGTLFGELGRQGLIGPATRMLGRYHDDPGLVPETDLESEALATLDAAAEPRPPVELVTTEGGVHAALRYRGPYADMRNAYRWLYGTWLPRSGHEPADAPALEEYLNNPRDTPPTELLTVIMLPLKAG